MYVIGLGTSYTTVYKEFTLEIPVILKYKAISECEFIGILRSKCRQQCTDK